MANALFHHKNTGRFLLWTLESGSAMQAVFLLYQEFLLPQLGTKMSNKFNQYKMREKGEKQILVGLRAKGKY
jgi:hypothetical protein